MPFVGKMRPGRLVLPAAALAVLAATCAALSGETEVVVSQHNRQFAPGTVSVAPGHPVVIVNDDAGIIHHAYVESPGFNFDSGDQSPGSRTPITFPAAGDYTVLCGIHPKMKLVVHVR